MTREEEIIAEYEAAQNRKLSKGEKEFILNVLQWADEHPICPWISVEQRLPPINQKTAESDCVFVRIENATTCREWIEQPAKYNVHIKDWIAMDFTHIGKRGGKVTHWMPIPELKGGIK